MRLTCPHCGERDLREFAYKGDALALSRPEANAELQAWHEYLHIRDNPAGPTRELWYHTPCGSWMVAERDTATHAVHRTMTPAEATK
ncbi:MAG: sarcosine oxidase subunit delta [Silicimonas sp.]|nr:sarcosine oxidase subunit delta [Silicimonas sp.]